MSSALEDARVYTNKYSADMAIRIGDVSKAWETTSRARGAFGHVSISSELFSTKPLLLVHNLLPWSAYSDFDARNFEVKAFLITESAFESNVGFLRSLCYCQACDVCCPGAR